MTSSCVSVAAVWKGGREGEERGRGEREGRERERERERERGQLNRIN